MPNPCLTCGEAETRNYTISRGSVTRHVSLCSEHGEPVEFLIKASTQRKRGQASILRDLSQLKPSRAMLARERGPAAP